MKLQNFLFSALAMFVSCLADSMAWGQICTDPLTTAQRNYKVKFFPGHYVAITGTWNALSDTLNEVASNKNIIGIQKRYSWANLQTGPTSFDFKRVTDDIALAESKGKKLSVMILWKYRAIGGISPVPKFIDDLTTSPIDYELGGEEGYGPAATGWLAAMDNPIVVREFVKFLKKLSEAIDSKNGVANLVFQETAMGVSKESYEKAWNKTLTNSQADDIQNRYIDGVIKANQQASCAFKHTPVIQLTNFPIHRLGDMTSSHKKWGVGMGGPDVWLNDDDLERPTSSIPMRAYDYYPLVEEAIPIGVIVASGNYRYESHYPETIKDTAEKAEHTFQNLYGWSVDKVTYELGKKAIDQLAANYIFWKRDHKDDVFYLSFRRHSEKIGTALQTIKPTPKGCPTQFLRSCVQSL